MKKHKLEYRVAIICRLAFVWGVVGKQNKKHGISLTPLGYSSSCVLELLDKCTGK